MLVLSKPIKGIFLDIGWTMNAPVTGHWTVSRALYEEVGKARYDAIPAERANAAFDRAMEYLAANHLLTTEEEEYGQFKRFYELLAEDLPELGLSKRAIARIARDKVYNDALYMFFDDVKPVLEALYKSYKLGIISDTWPSAARVLRNAGVYDYFSAITFSCHLGVYKPHPRMYEAALESMGLGPEQTLFVDDAPENLDGAAQHGIQPVLITRRERPEGHEKYIVADDFHALLALLN